MKKDVNVSSAPVRRIGVCVDDFGMHEGIDSAAMALAASGVASAISCMTTRAGWRKNALQLRQLSPSKVDVGLHLDIGSGTQDNERAVGEEPLHRIHLASYLRFINVDRARAQIRLQFDEFENCMQRLPSYVDGHRHIHQLPVVRDLLLEEIMARYGRSKPWIRSTRAASLSPKGLLIRALGGVALDACARQAGLRTSSRLLGTYDFNLTPAQYWAQLKSWVKNCSDGDVLMCHPARWVTADVAHGDARTIEFEALQSRKFAALLRSLAVEVRPPSRYL